MTGFAKLLLCFAISPMLLMGIGYFLMVMCPAFASTFGFTCKTGSGIGANNSVPELLYIYGFLGCFVIEPIAGVLALIGVLSGAFKKKV